MNDTVAKTPNQSSNHRLKGGMRWDAMGCDGTDRNHRGMGEWMHIPENIFEEKLLLYK